MKTGLFIKKVKSRGRGRQKNKTSPPKKKGRERLKIRLPLTRDIRRGTLKNSPPLTARQREGKTLPLRG